MDVTKILNVGHSMEELTTVLDLQLTSATYVLLHPIFHLLNTISPVENLFLVLIATLLSAATSSNHFSVCSYFF